MPGLLIKEFPEALHYKLKALAARNKRSMTKEALYILEIALNEAEDEQSPILPEPFQGSFLLTDEWIDKAKREGRA
jgi:plasmid stability protein